MAIASQVPVLSAAHDAAKVFIGITVPLFTAAITTLAARIVSKRRAGVRYGWDDGFIVIGFLIATADWGLLMAAIAWATDSSISFTTPAIATNTIKLGVIATPFWGFSIGFIKLSVACLLLRFTQNNFWKLFLFILMALITFVMVASSIFSIVQCVPLSAVWDITVVGAKCASPNTIRIVSNTTGGFSIATDLVLSIFPLTFLINLRRPIIEKALILVLMAIGLTASAASIFKFIVIQDWVKDRDGMYVGFTISTLSTVELLIGSTAACLPCLKAPIQRALASIGINFNWGSSTPSVHFRNVGQVLTLHDESPKAASQELEKKESSQTDESTGEDLSKQTAIDLESGEQKPR